MESQQWGQRSPMPIHSRFALAAAQLVLAAACSTQPSALQSASAPSNVCVAGQSCTLTGLLGIQVATGNYSVASLEPKDGPCVPLLLSKAMSQKYRKLDGKPVTISGEALAKAAVADGVVEIQYRDRWLQTGFCGQSDIVIYVDRVGTSKP
jgi:O-succinylbenzoate synthase